MMDLHEFMYYLPKYYRKSHMVNLLMEVEGSQHAEFRAMTADIVANCYINTATWGLDIFEEMAGIYTDPTKDIEDRRAVLRSRYGGFGTATIPFLKEIATKFENRDMSITNVPTEYAIEIEFDNIDGAPRNIPDVRIALERITPAHYEVRFRFKYMSWDVLNADQYTWAEWDIQNFTWDHLG